MSEPVRFALLVGGALAVVGLYLLALRHRHGDGAALMGPAFLGTIAISGFAALGAAVLIAVSPRPGLAALLAALSGIVLMLGGGALLDAILPRAVEAAGPGAMAMMWPAALGLAAVPFGLVLRLLLGLFRALF